MTIARETPEAPGNELQAVCNATRVHDLCPARSVREAASRRWLQLGAGGSSRAWRTTSVRSSTEGRACRISSGSAAVVL